MKIEIDRLNQEIEELKAENARYRAALEYYASNENEPIDYLVAREALKGE